MSGYGNTRSVQRADSLEGFGRSEVLSRATVRKAWADDEPHHLTVEPQIGLDKKKSYAMLMSSALITGDPDTAATHSRVNLRASLTYPDDLEDMYIEDVITSGENVYKPKTKRNVRATMGFWRLMWFDFKNWYRRWRVKHQEMPLFKEYIKTMERNFGSGIGSMFVFTRWVVLLNLVLSVCWLGSVILPMAISFDYSQLKTEFAFKNLLDGKNVQTYLLIDGDVLQTRTVIGARLETILQVIDNQSQGVIEELWVFYGVYKDTVGGQYHLGLAYLIMLLLTYFGSLHVVLRSILIGGGCSLVTMLVIYISFSHVVPNEGSGESTDFLSTYGTTIIFILINNTVPSCIKLLPKMEHYPSGRTELNITLMRIFFLRMANLFSLVISLYSSVTNATDASGQLTYSFGKYFWRRQKAEFNISSNVLNLVYRQALVWVGTLACPVLPIVGLLSHLVFFFVNYRIILKTCKPPEKRWSQSRNTSFFTKFLLFSLSLILIPASVVIGSSSVINLGQTDMEGQYCGPFGDSKPTSAFTSFCVDQVHWLKTGLEWLVSEVVVLPIVLVLVSILMYQWTRIDGESGHSLILHAELTQEREENKTLVKKLQGMGINISENSVPGKRTELTILPQKR